LNYGTLGIGSSSHLNTISFESMAGVRLTPVHYRGGAPALTDVIGGHTGSLPPLAGCLRFASNRLGSAIGSLLG
jgi:hypothetical protein